MAVSPVSATTRFAPAMSTCQTMLTTQAPSPYLDCITKFVLSPLDLPNIRKACTLGRTTVQFASALAECQPYCEVRHLLQLCHRLARCESPEFSWFASAVAQMIHLGPSAIEKFHLPTLQLGVSAWSAAATTDLTDCIRHSKFVLGHAGLENRATDLTAITDIKSILSEDAMCAAVDTLIVEAAVEAAAASGDADALAAAQKAKEDAETKAQQLKSSQGTANHSLEQLGKYVHLLGEIGVELDLDWQNMCEQLCMADAASLRQGYIQSVDLEGVNKPEPNMNPISYTHATMQLLSFPPATPPTAALLDHEPLLLALTVDALQGLCRVLRTLLGQFRLPGEAQQVDRVMESLSRLWFEANKGNTEICPMSDPDTVYMLSYSLIMLNTDAHHAMIQNKMTCDQFQRSNRGIDNHGDLPDVFMEQLYNEIVSDEIVLHIRS